MNFIELKVGNTYLDRQGQRILIKYKLRDLFSTRYIGVEQDTLFKTEKRFKPDGTLCSVDYSNAVQSIYDLVEEYTDPLKTEMGKSLYK